MSTKKPIPKTQEQISQDSLSIPYIDGNRPPTNNFNSNRALHRSVSNDSTKKFNIGLVDIDEAIYYYFNNIIRPSVIQNGTFLNVPILYGSPERWAAVQKEGYYRDKNGKIQAPLIMFKRESIEKNRNLGNKLDANQPNNFGIFTKKYSKKNFYDKFSVLTNRNPITEYYGIIIPDYVNIQYSCIIFTDYIEQMNKIVESINYASDAYWGDPEKFRFRAMIDSYNTATELNQGEDRKIRTEFTINLLGHIIPDSINSQLNGLNKFYSKSAINFKIETVGDDVRLIGRSQTPEKEARTRFFDSALIGSSGSTLTLEQVIYLSTSNSAEADLVTTNVATFSNKQFITPPSGIQITQSLFDVYVNGVLVDEGSRTVSESGNDVIVTFNLSRLQYNLSTTDQVIVIGKIQDK